MFFMLIKHYMYNITQTIKTINYFNLLFSHNLKLKTISFYLIYLHKTCTRYTSLNNCH